jgi:hypothetical protein
MTDLFSKLKLFRDNVFANIPIKSSCVVNLLDSLCADGRRVKSVVELSTSKYFQRNYCSVTRAITEGLASMDWDSCLNRISSDRSSLNGYRRFVLDVTPLSRPHSVKLKDRSCVYSPNPSPGNKPITIGHQYSVLAELPQGRGSERKNWIIPRSCKRLSSSKNGTVLGIQQMKEIQKERGFEQERTLIIGDRAYGSKECLAELDPSSHLLLCRSRNNRVVWKKSKLSLNHKKTRGGQKHYGDKMNLDKPNTHLPAEGFSQFQYQTRNGKSIQVQAQYWDQMVYRSSKKAGYIGHENEFRLMKFQLLKESGEALFDKPLWLIALGSWKDEISMEEYFYHYRDRYDIEHFFRFGKNNLLMDQYQTPNVDHEEDWWRLVCLAYQQLFLAKEQVEHCPQDWEKYLPENKQCNSSLSSPSQTQRGFSKVLDQIGTPAHPPKNRKGGEGRQKGAFQLKREDQAIVWKTRSTFKTKSDSSRSSAKGSSPPNLEMNQKDLIKLLKRQILNSNYTLNEIGLALLSSK